LKENLYFTTPLLRPLHNETFFAINVGYSLPHVSLPYFPHIFSFNCIWPILLQSILKYSLIQAYVTFQSYHVVFVDVPFLHCQLIGLLLVKLLIMLICMWMTWSLQEIIQRYFKTLSKQWSRSLRWWILVSFPTT
jgi:hypothetical protein